MRRSMRFLIAVFVLVAGVLGCTVSRSSSLGKRFDVKWHPVETIIDTVLRTED
jgi:hypothetical protein